MRSILLLLFILSTANHACAQESAVISGFVTASGGSKPVPDAHVFLSGSMVGTTSDAQGRFILVGVPIGASRLVVSSVGFRGQSHDILIRRAGRYGQNFELEEAVVQIGEILITGERDENWDRRLILFGRQFLGVSDNARDTEILNPEVLSFQDVDGWLWASAESPLRIENRALGYAITHFLHHFQSKGNETRQEGEAYYEPLEPVDEATRARWEDARQRAYLGSHRHFLRASIEDRLPEEGFYVYRADNAASIRASTAGSSGEAPTGFAVGPRYFIAQADEEGEFRLTFPLYLEVVYTGERETRAYRRWQGMPQGIDLEYQRSWIQLTRDFALLDRDGNVLDPQSIIHFGYMAFERLADSVPREYGLDPAAR